MVSRVEVLKPDEPRGLVTVDMVKESPEVHALIRASDEQLAVQGYTEHGFRHVGLVAHISQNILLRLGTAGEARRAGRDRGLSP